MMISISVVRAICEKDGSAGFLEFECQRDKPGTLDHPLLHDSLSNSHRDLNMGLLGIIAKIVIPNLANSH
jgi:hypothetical protein